MTIVAAIRGMLSAGLTIEQALTAAELMEAAMPKSGIDAQAERRREKDRLRQAEKRLRKSAESADFRVTQGDISASEPEACQAKTRLKPSENRLRASYSDGVSDAAAETPLPTPLLFEPVEQRRHHWPSDYKEQFWRLYPKRVDKRAAMEALAVVRRADKIAWQDVTDGVERLKAFVEPKFHPYPAKWLKNERWADEHQPEALRAPSFADLANGFDAQINGDRPNFQSPRPRRKSLIDGLNEVMEMIPDDE